MPLGISQHSSPVARQFRINAAGIISYDFLMQSFAISGGYVTTRDDGHNYIPPPRPVP
jgi:hypothetical protein